MIQIVSLKSKHNLRFWRSVVSALAVSMSFAAELPKGAWDEKDTRLAN